MARRKAHSTEPGEENNHDVSKPALRVQAENNSIAVGGMDIRGDVMGSITIGHGYTAEQVSLLLTQITSTLQPRSFDGRCPYKGLEVFEEEDAELFFGRERLVNELVTRVRGSRTVFITGPSGSGKSSLVRAGVLHTLKQGTITGSDRWLYETMKPGREPLKDLALAFSRLKSPELADYFQAHANETNILHKCAESALSGRKDQRFVLFVDQFEEVFTQISQEEERLAFLHMLAYAGTAENGRVIVLFAMRSDFVSNCATYPMINELLSQQFRQIGAMQPEELVAAIALPARHVGLPIEDELIARIINDMKGEPGALPLMQFALKDLFDSQQENGGVIALRLEDYLKHGGIHKSLERHADKSFAELNENEQQLARSIFSGLIEIGRGTSDTRRTARFEELIPAQAKPEEVEVIVRKLADARLIITDEQAGKDTVTISHEKLIDAWPWLKKLVNENRDVIALQNEIASDAKEWEEHRRDPSYLYTGARLVNAREQLDTKKLVLSGLAQDFVMAGQAQQRRSQRARVLGIAIPIAVVVFAIVLFSYLSATNSTKIAKQSEEFANTQQAAASTSDAFAALAQQNAQAAEEAEAEAQEQLRIARAGNFAALALSQMDRRLDLALLLAVESMKQSDTYASQHALLTLLQSRPLRLGTLSGPGAGAISLAFVDDILAAGYADGTVYLWKITDPARPAAASQIPTNSGLTTNSLLMTEDGQTLVVGSENGKISIWNISNPDEPILLSELQANSAVQHLVVLQEEYPTIFLLASSHANETVNFWDISDPKKPVQMEQTLQGHSISLHQDISQNILAVADEEGNFQFWNLETFKQVGGLQVGGEVSILRDPGTRLSSFILNTLDRDQELTFWDINDPRSPTQISQLQLEADIAITSLASGRHDITNRDLKSGTIMAIGNSKGEIFLWDFTNFGPTQLGRLVREEESSVIDLAIDTNILASMYEDGTLILWDLEPASWMQRACQSAGRNFTRAEWLYYFAPERDYPSQPEEVTCPQWPLEP